MVPIYGFSNYTIDELGFIRNAKGKLLTPTNKRGYLRVRLKINGKTVSRNVHRLVYESFNGEIPNTLQVNHINGIRNDNRLINLEVCTSTENNERRVFLTRGVDVNTSKLNEKQVLDIRARKKLGQRSLDLAKEYGVNKSTINKIATGSSWKHLPILPVDNKIWSNNKLTGKMSGKTLEDKYGKEYFSKIRNGNKFKKHCETCSCY